MIPKIIHYCWYGRGEMSPELKMCMESWTRLLPDYEWKLWNEDNLPPGSDFLKLMFKYRKFALISDYIRFYALYHEGGLYFDTDIEVVKNFDSLLREKCFLGFQQESLSGHPLNAAVCGAVPRHPYMRDCLAMFLRECYRKVKPYIGPTVVSEVAKKWGLAEYGEQYLGDVKIFPKEVFYPYHWEEDFYPECVTESTMCIHRWQKSWERKRDFKALRKSASFKTERLRYIAESLFKRKKQTL